MARTYASEKTRPPQISFSLAIKSGMGLVFLPDFLVADKYPIGLPRFSMRISSPSPSHASTLEKLFLKSLTVTFFMWTNYVHIF